MKRSIFDIILYILTGFLIIFLCVQNVQQRKLIKKLEKETVPEVVQLFPLDVDYTKVPGWLILKAHNVESLQVLMDKKAKYRVYLSVLKDKKAKFFLMRE